MTQPGPSPRSGIGALLVDPAPLRLDREFRLLWIGQSISLLGRMITLVVLPYQVYVLTGDVLTVGALSIAQLVPILAFTLGGGAFADAVDRRKVLIVTQIALALCSAAFAIVSLTPEPSIASIFAIAFVAAGLGAVDQPARASAVPRLVPLVRLPSALSLNQVANNTARVVGPAIGGIVIAVVGVAAAYLLDVITFGAALATLLLMRPILPLAGAARPSVRSVVAGLRFAASRREVLATFVIDINAMVFGSPRSLFPALALDVFHVGAAGVGLMSAAAGFGALVGAAFSGWAAVVRRPGRAVLLSVAVWSLGIAGFGLAVFSFPLALACLAVASGADVISAVLRNSIVQILTPDALRGRVSSIQSLVVNAGPRIGDAEASGLAAAIGVQGSVVSGGLLSLAGLGLIAIAMPELASLDIRVAMAEAEADAVAAPTSG